MTVSKRLRLEVLRRDGYKCHYCHTADAPLTVDHVVPRALGGPDTAENLVACCQECNLARETEYVHAVQRLWETCTSLDDEYCLPLPGTWSSSARYWVQLGVPEALLEYAFTVAKERYDCRQLKARNVFAYASGIIGNRMEEASRMAQKRSE